MLLEAHKGIVAAQAHNDPMRAITTPDSKVGCSQADHGELSRRRNPQ